MSKEKLNQEEEMGMELTLEGDEILDEEMEEIIEEKVKQSEKESKKRKKGPKKSNKNSEGKTKKPKKKKEINYNDIRFIEREIKKGRISAPCFRIEKVDEDKTYDLLESKGIVFSKDAKYEKYNNTPKMVDGKWMVTLKAAEQYGDKFKGKHKDGTEIEHEFVRVELHKPGREKDVIETYKVSWAKDKQKTILKKQEEKKKKLEEEKKKKLEEEKKKKLEEESKKEDKK